MNIHEFGVDVDSSNPSEPKAPHWWVFLSASVPSTLLLVAVMYWFYGRKRKQATRKGSDHEIGRKSQSLC